VFVYEPDDPCAYAYVLGLYLGDGCLNRTARSWQLRITLDAAYPGIVDEAAAAVAAHVPHGRVARRLRTHARCVVLDSGWKRWPEVFPQHGPGRKHERPIVLRDWQTAIVDRHPERFVRGLIQSDGSRTVNRFRTRLESGRVAEYAYPRYFFTNASDDIRALFCSACDRLDIRWTQSNARNISIAHRRSVAVLDEVVGPKA
jgi:hypothetical protein